MKNNDVIERELLQNLCNEFTSNGLKFQSEKISSENMFSVLNIIDKEVMYCRTLLYLIKNNWDSFEKNVLGSCCDNEDLILIEIEHLCESPCDDYEKEGRIDIFLKTKNHVVAIEVKVGAGDQEHQLIRYKKELENHSEKSKHLFYLTKEGSEASTNSLNCTKKCSIIKENEKCFVAKTTYEKISFNVNILNWLGTLTFDCEEHSIAKDFYEVLKMSENNYDEYINLLKESSDYPKIILKLNEAIPILFDEIRNTFFSAISDKLKNNYGFVEESKEEKTYNREKWPKTLIKKGKPLIFCYETNFFFRTDSDKKWIYLNKCVFNDNSNHNYTTGKPKEAFHIHKLDDSSIILLDWYYEKDNEKKNITIEKIAFAANEFWKK